MRTGPRKWRELMTGVEPSLRAATERLDSVKAIILSFLKPFGFSAIEFNCYRNSRWELSALTPKQPDDIPGSCKWISMPVDMTSFMNDPGEQLNEFLDMCSDELGGDEVKQEQSTHPLVEEISKFSDACNEEEYTDTGDAWDLLNRCQEELDRLHAVERDRDMIQRKAEHGCSDARCGICDER